MRITEMYVHPLKSCRGNAISSAEVSPLGLAYDRRFMLVTPDGRFMTGREYPRMVLISVQMDESGANFSAPGMGDLRVELDMFPSDLDVVLWRSNFPARVGAEAADAWFTEYLGVSCRLSHIDQTTTRRTNLDANAPVAFADGYPVLLIGSASLADLNERLEDPVTMRHFRTNLVVETSQPYEEDNWRFVRIGGVLFENMKRCERCVFTTIDPDTATPNAMRQPLMTLAKYRRFDAGPCFGINLIPRETGTLHRGDFLSLVEG